MAIVDVTLAPDPERHARFNTFTSVFIRFVLVPKRAI